MSVVTTILAWFPFNRERLRSARTPAPASPSAARARAARRTLTLPRRSTPGHVSPGGWRCDNCRHEAWSHSRVDARRWRMQVDRRVYRWWRRAGRLFGGHHRRGRRRVYWSGRRVRWSQRVVRRVARGSGDERTRRQDRRQERQRHRVARSGRIGDRELLYYLGPAAHRHLSAGGALAADTGQPYGD